VFVLPVDLLEIGLQIEESLIADVAFAIVGFVLLGLWPLTLAVFAVRMSDMLSWRRAISISIVVFLPFALLLALIFV
jgi:hypothetical protein